MSSDSDFEYDVFLSHSVKDKDTVRDIANRLKSDGVRVWFDAWEIKPGDSTRAKIEDGLERSRVLVLCLSAAALAADWPQLLSHTFRFKDPLNDVGRNRDRRFIPLRLDDAPTKGPLAQFSYIDWRPEQREQEYPKLLEACRFAAKPEEVGKNDASERLAEKAIQLDTDKTILGYDFSPIGDYVLASGNKDVGLWDIRTGRCERVFDGHTNWFNRVTWIADQRNALSCDDDSTVRLWEVATEGAYGFLKVIRAASDV